MQAPPILRRQPLIQAALAGTALLGACAWLTHRFTRQAEDENLPRGQFVAARGIRLHYTEHGDPSNPALVLLHGNGAMAREMEISGLVEMAAQRYRVIVFDRPGYGHSQRPNGHSYTPAAQAETIVAALRAIGVRKPVVLGHSWGALVAYSMGLAYPEYLRALVLVSGYYTPSFRFDTFFLGAPAIPVLGTLMRHTVSPLLGRLMWPLMVRRLFAPARVTAEFENRYPVWMSLRPGQLKASASEAAMLTVQASRLHGRAAELSVPTVLVAGEKDRLVMTFWQSERMRRRLLDAPLHVVPGAGHMVHHTATPQVMQAVHEAFDLSAQAVRVAAPRNAPAASLAAGAAASLDLAG